MKLICIDDVVDIIGFGDGVKELTWGKEYHIMTDCLYNVDGRRYVSVINDKGRNTDYLIDRFVDLESFREIQLNKIGI